MTKPKYIDSGIAWIGKIPATWKVVPCRAIMCERNDRNDGVRYSNYLSLLANIGILPYEEKGDIGNKKPEDLGKCKIVHEGDLVINSMNYYIGSYGRSPYHGICSPVYIVLYPQEKNVYPPFAFRIFENAQFQKYVQSFGNGILEHRKAVNWDIFKNLKIALPPLEEQGKIAAFIDKTTRDVDHFIADKRKLIALLGELRQSVISEAVTKGLNRKAAMKDSGIAWIGEIPKHWEVKRLKYLCEPKRGASPRPIDDPIYFDDEGERYWVRISDVTKSKKYLLECEQRLSSIGIEKSVPIEAGDLFVSICASVGKPCISKVKACIHDGFVLLSGLPKHLTDYVYYLFESELPFKGLGKLGTQLNLNSDTVRNLVIPVHDDIPKIVSHLDRETARIDSVIANVEMQIEKLKEYRQSIISEAVTGKVVCG